MTTARTGKAVKLATPQSAWEKLWLARRKGLRCRGKGIEDMPGVDADHKKLNWFLWTRGLLNEDMTHPQSKWLGKPKKCKFPSKWNSP